MLFHLIIGITTPKGTDSKDVNVLTFLAPKSCSLCLALICFIDVAFFLDDTRAHMRADTHAHKAHFERINCCPLRKINAFFKRPYDVRLLSNGSPNIQYLPYSFPQPKIRESIYTHLKFTTTLAEESFNGSLPHLFPGFS